MCYVAMSTFLQQLMVQASNAQVEAFQARLRDKMTRQEYVYALLSTFLHMDASTRAATDFADRAHRLIDRTSLCEPETVFLHEVVDAPLCAQYTDSLLQAYRRVPDLSQCQLGPALLRCLQASQHVQVRD